MTTPIRFQHRTAGALLIILFAAICGTAQLSQLPQTRTEPANAKVESKSGDVSGTVVTESGQPLVNAQVYLRSPATEGGPATLTTTNREGVFKFSGVGKGSYTVTAYVPAYIPKATESGPTVRSAIDSVTLVFIKGGVISGTVTNSKGDPIVAIGIKVEMVLDELGRKTPPFTFENVTDDRGAYRVYGLRSGTYIVSADGGPNYSPTGVNAFAVDMPTYAPSSSREEADQISVRTGEEATVDIRYRGERGSAISGFVKGVRTGDRGFSVSLTSLKENGTRWNTPFRDANGEFAFEGVPDGDYHLLASAYWNDRERGLSDSIVLNVRGADIEGLQLTAAALASISGAVVLKELKEPVAECNDKRPPMFSDTTVTAWHRVTQGDKQKPQFVWRSRGIESANSQGNFTLRELAASEYHFTVRFSGQQWYLQSIAFVPSTPGGKPTDATRSWTTLKPGDQLSGLTVTLAQGGGLIRGQITLAEGQTLPAKLTAYLVPAEATQADDALRYFAAPLSTDGYFFFPNVAPGRYWMLAQQGDDDTRQPVSKLRLPDAAVKRSTLRHAAEQKKTELDLKPCQDLIFRVPL